MDAQATAWIPRAFLNMPEPRHHNFRHRLFDILTIALFAVMFEASRQNAKGYSCKKNRSNPSSFLAASVPQ